MCLVRGRSLGDLANSSAPELSSKALQKTVGVLLTVKIFVSCISWSKLIKGIASRKACDKLMYSASVVLKVTCVCNFEHHTTGQPAYMIMNPVRDLAVLASC